MQAMPHLEREDEGAHEPHLGRVSGGAHDAASREGVWEGRGDTCVGCVGERDKKKRRNETKPKPFVGFFAKCKLVTG